MSPEKVAENLEFYNTVVSCREKVENADFWKSLWVNDFYFKIKGNRRKFLMLKGPALEAANKLLTIRPDLEKLAEAFYKNSSKLEGKECLRQARNANSFPLIDCVISNLFFESFVSRYGLGSKYGVDFINELDYSNAEQWAQNQQDHGWTPLRTWAWQFGSYDEIRVVSYFLDDWRKKQLAKR